MYILTITYPNIEGATFDWDYYRETHLPLAGEVMQPHGLGYASVLRGETGVDGSPPAYLALATFSFATEKGARAAVASQGAGRLMADIANFTSVAPVMQFNTAIP